MVLKVFANRNDSVILCSFRGTFLVVRRLWEATQQCFLQHNMPIKKNTPFWSTVWMWSWKLMMVILPSMLLCPTSIFNQSTLVISSSPKHPHMMFESSKCQYRLIATAVAFQSDLQCSCGIISADRAWGSQKCSAGVAEHTSHRSVSFCMNRYPMAQNDNCHAGKTEHHNSF